MTIVGAQYDVFISYSSTDAPWVEELLIPQLKAAALSICTEHETFDIGVPQIINRERAIEQSRHTLIVLSPAWLAHEWAEFEALLVQTTDPAARARKLLPLLLHPRTPPNRIAMLHAADFTTPEHREAQIQRVIAAIKGTLQLTDVTAPLSDMLGPKERNRRAMLRKVRTIWIDGLLKQSLYHETLIALGLHERPDAVDRSLDVLVYLPHQVGTPLPPTNASATCLMRAMGRCSFLARPVRAKPRSYSTWPAICLTVPNTTRPTQSPSSFPCHRGPSADCPWCSG